MAAQAAGPSDADPPPAKKLGLTPGQPIPEPSVPADPPEHTDPFTSGHSEDD